MTSPPATVTAAYIDATGPADVIRVGALPTPVPGDGEVLVRTQAIGVNHVDTFVRSGAYPTPLTFPFVIGRDAVGTVAAVGTGVAGFLAGDAVWCNSLGHGGRQGPSATYTIVAAERLYPLPAGVDPVAAAAVLHTGATAHLGLFREARLRAGETVVVGGAAGGVGSAVVQIAAEAGARVIAVARSEQVPWCRSSGAQEVLDRRAPDLIGRLHKAAPDGIDVYWDTSGHHDLEQVVPLLAPRGRVILMAGLDAHPTLPVGTLYTRDASLRGFALSNATTDELADTAAALNSLLAGGTLRAGQVQALPLSQAPHAHALLENGRATGRLVLLP
ncbi:NADPH:quinone reductase [Kitasatospora sp. NPDC048540]|uniref:NADPH:quinone reductase n=1 Tax=unclassified Kitasatospora TaxID=2633591 RepID=UPI0005398588|nr:NADPH:quinone reductase [Kitasatospora sp. MBT63]